MAPQMSSHRRTTHSETTYKRLSITEGATKALDLRPVEVSYLQDQWDEISITTTSTEAVVTVSNRVGVIGLPTQRVLHIEPKIECDLFGMLVYAGRLDKEFIADRHEAATTTGDRFLDLLARLFQQELERIFRRGLAQAYRRTAETKRHIRGQLNLERQLQNQGPTPTKFECEYEEQTYDIPLNQLVVAALDVLIQLLGGSGNRSTLIQYRSHLETKVSNRPPAELSPEAIELTNLHSYYRRIYLLSKTILNDQSLENLSRPDQPFPSLIFDMPGVFEDTVVSAVDAAIDSEQYHVTEDGIWTLAETIDEPTDRRSMQPDFIIQRQNDDLSGDETVVVVGDAKWKDDTKPSQDDLYQLAAYQSKYNTPGILVYPTTTEEQSVSEIKYEYEYADAVGASGGRGPLYVVNIPVAPQGDYQSYAAQLNDSLTALVDRALSK